jgi:hypothetical protein
LAYEVNIDKALRVGEKERLCRNKAHFIGRPSKLLGLESVKDAAGNVIREPPLPIWANFRQRALDIAILQINKMTDLKIEIESIEQAKHRRVTSVTFGIEEQAVPKSH